MFGAVYSQAGVQARWHGADLESDPLWLLNALLATYKLDFLDLGQLTIDDLDSTPRESLNIEELSRSSC